MIGSAANRNKSKMLHFIAIFTDNIDLNGLFIFILQVFFNFYLYE